MLIDLESYLQDIITECRTTYGERLLYLGLQGSYLRGEASEDSDIDIMLILEDFSVSDMDSYREILKKIGYYDRSCGFICGRKEIAAWNPLEVSHLRHTTRDLYGSLNDYLPKASKTDEINFLKISLGDLYHELCHRYIHADREKNVLRFRGTSKRMFFLIQDLYYLENGVFAVTKRDLKRLVSKEDLIMLNMAELPDGYDFDWAFGYTIDWCRKAFQRIDALSSR